MRISDWSSDVCSSDLPRTPYARRGRIAEERPGGPAYRARAHRAARSGDGRGLWQPDAAEPGRLGPRGLPGVGVGDDRKGAPPGDGFRELGHVPWVWEPGELGRASCRERVGPDV